MYLANDVIQNSKKKGPEFSRDFAPVLTDAYAVATKYDTFIKTDCSWSCLFIRICIRKHSSLVGSVEV